MHIIFESSTLRTSGAPDDEITRQVQESTTVLEAILSGKPLPDTMTAAAKDPTLSHLFAPTLTGSMADYSDPASKLTDDFLSDAVTFLTKTLAR